MNQALSFKLFDKIFYSKIQHIVHEYNQFFMYYFNLIISTSIIHMDNKK
jgi:hypothetical protein